MTAAGASAGLSRILGMGADSRQRQPGVPRSRTPHLRPVFQPLDGVRRYPDATALARRVCLGVLPSRTALRVLRLSDLDRENLLNIARYMVDARAHQLPLVGGLDPEVFMIDRNSESMGLLNHDTTLAFLTRVGAVALMLWVVKQSWTVSSV